MSDSLILFEGRVTKVEMDTTGYGDNARPVGVAVTIRMDAIDSFGSYTKDTVLHLNRHISQPMVGDVVSIHVRKVVELPDVEDDEVVEARIAEARALARGEEPSADESNGVTIDELEEEPR